MSSDPVYRCLNCLEHTVTRGFDVSHLSTMCPVCDSFERLINESVYDRFRAFEDDPPAGLDWERLDRGEKLMISEQVVREGRSVEEFAVED